MLLLFTCVAVECTNKVEHLDSFHIFNTVQIFHKFIQERILNRFNLVFNHYTSHIGIMITIHLYSNRTVSLNVHAHEVRSPLLNSCWKSIGYSSFMLLCNSIPTLLVYSKTFHLLIENVNHSKAMVHLYIYTFRHPTVPYFEIKKVQIHFIGFTLKNTQVAGINSCFLN